jgi:tRNA(Leu) C34 or U34 (ribose-2'-O)-methylase TrmL
MHVLRGYAAVALADPRDPKNVAHALRACGAFGAAFLTHAGIRYKRSTVDTQKAYRHMPLIHAGDSAEDVMRMLPFDCVPIAVECNGSTPLEHFEHPERAFYVFGPEDGNLSDVIIKSCRNNVRIPSVFCLNLAAAVNVVLYDRAAKNSPNRSVFINGIREPHP